MAHLGKIEVVVSDPATGLPVSGATVEIRKQGGTVQGTTGPTTINVHSQGAMDVGDTVNIDGDTDVPVSLDTQPTATQITVGGVGLSPLVNDITRVTVTIPLQTIHNAEDGAETKANPLTTDANGLAFAYAPVGFYDVLVTRGGVKTLLVNVVAIGGSKFISNAFTATDSGFAWDTKRVPGGSSYLWKIAGVTKVSMDAAGTTLTVPALLATDAVAILGDLTLASPADLIMGTAASRLIPGATSFAVRDNADARDNFLLIDAGDGTIFRDFNMRRLEASQATALVVGDVSISAGWGTTAVVNAVAGKDAHGGITINSAGTGQAANPTITVTFKDGVFAGAPVVVCSPNPNTTDLTVNDVWYGKSSTSTLEFTYGGTPVAGRSYIFQWICLGV